MLVYLDTAQFAWLERADEQLRTRFINGWRDHGCELSVSLQLLQEVVKRGSAQDVEARLETMRSLRPIRGIPTAAAGVIVMEARVQMLGLMDRPVANPIEYGVSSLFPMMDEGVLAQDTWSLVRHLDRFNRANQVLAALENTGRVLPKTRKGVRIDPDEIEAHVRRSEELLADGTAETARFLRTIGENVIRGIKEADGDPRAACVRDWGLADLRCLSDIREEDLLKAAAFLGAVTFAAEHIAVELRIQEEEVLELVNELRPYEAPGYCIEMAVSRARAAHTKEPTAGDHVDEEHVSFAPYVDLMFVDKRTLDFVDRERRRKDGRMVDGAPVNITRARDLENVLEQIQRAKRNTPLEGDPY